MGNNFTMPTFGNFAQNMNNFGWNTPTSFAPNYFGWGNSLWGVPLGTTKKKTAEELAKECDDKIKTLNEQIEQQKALKDQKGQVQAEDGSIVETPSLNEMKNEYKNAETTADGTKVTYAKTEKMGFWQKAWRGLTNISKGAMGTLKSLIGFEPDGSWNWKKCLKNVAITAACCFAGPIFGAGLTAIGLGAAAPAAVAAIGTATRVATTALKYYSIYKLGEGVYKGCTAETTKEFDEGWQQVGTAGFTLFGTRAISKAINKTTSAYTNSGTTAQAAAAPQTPQTFGDKVWSLSGGKIVNGIKQDFSPSSWKATWQGGYASGTHMEKAITQAKTDAKILRINAKGQGFTARAKAFCKGTWDVTKSIGRAFTQDRRFANQNEAKISKKEFETRMQQNRDLLDQHINKLNQQIDNPSTPAAQKDALTAIRDINVNLRNGLDKVTTRQDWANLQSQYRASVDQLSPGWKAWKTPKINGVEVDTNALSEVINTQKGITESFSGLVNSRANSIQAMSKVGKSYQNGTYRQEVDDFGYSRWNGGNRIDLWAMKHPTMKGKLGTVSVTAMGVLFDPTYAVANPISNTTGALWWNWAQAANPLLQATPEDGVDMIWTDERVAELDNGFKTIDDQIKALEAQKKAVYAEYDKMA